MYETKILADSISDEGHRLTTFSVTFPRFVLAELNTHRMFSRNSASSRAIPVAKSIQAVREGAFVPESFGRNQKGMSPGEDLEADQAALALTVWQYAIAQATVCAENFAHLEVHKSLANRILEPFKWHTAIITATDWDNFFALRTHKTAQPELRKTAQAMEALYMEHEPRSLSEHDWHLPLVNEEEIVESINLPDLIDYNFWTKVSIGRCARVSYLTHEGKRDPSADCELHDRLLASHHLSPFEHVARPFAPSEWDLIDSVQQYIKFMGNESQQEMVYRMCTKLEYVGNFRGWYQKRADIPNEDNAALYLDTSTA